MKSQSRKTNYSIKSSITVESKVLNCIFNQLTADRCFFFFFLQLIDISKIHDGCDGHNVQQRDQRENTMFMAAVLPLVSQVFQAASLLLQSWTWFPTVFGFLLYIAPTYPQPRMALFCTATPMTPLPHNTGNGCKAVLKHY